MNTPESRVLDTRPAVDGWFEEDPPALVADRCPQCATLRFPPQGTWCPDPRCAAIADERTVLSAQGTIWSYTDARYQPPPPYVAPVDPYEPFVLAAVELPEGITVLGQMAEGTTVDDVSVGDAVHLVIETLFVEDGVAHRMWRWARSEENAR